MGGKGNIPSSTNNQMLGQFGGLSHMESYLILNLDHVCDICSTCYPTVMTRVQPSIDDLRIGIRARLCFILIVSSYGSK